MSNNYSQRGNCLCSVFDDEKGSTRPYTWPVEMGIPRTTYLIHAKLEQKQTSGTRHDKERTKGISGRGQFFASIYPTIAMSFY
jgi:hypothetical protein